jgi:hypothetical protein
VLRWVFLAISAVVLVACATITRGTTQVVAVDTPGAPGASCKAEGDDKNEAETGTGFRAKRHDRAPSLLLKSCLAERSDNAAAAARIAAAAFIHGDLRRQQTRLMKTYAEVEAGRAPFSIGEARRLRGIDEGTTRRLISASLDGIRPRRGFVGT